LGGGNAGIGLSLRQQIARRANELVHIDCVGASNAWRQVGDASLASWTTHRDGIRLVGNGIGTKCHRITCAGLCIKTKSSTIYCVDGTVCADRHAIVGRCRHVGVCPHRRRWVSQRLGLIAHSDRAGLLGRGPEAYGSRVGILRHRLRAVGGGAIGNHRGNRTIDANESPGGSARASGRGIYAIGHGATDGNRGQCGGVKSGGLRHTLAIDNTARDAGHDLAAGCCCRLRRCNNRCKVGRQSTDCAGRGAEAG